MPRTRSLAWAELRIGLLALSAIVATAIVVFLLSGEGGFFWQRYALRARFPNVAGLKTGAPVRVAGVEVGTVKNIAFDGAQVEVRFELAKDMQSRVTDQSVAIIGSVSLLGEGSLDITPSTGGTPLAANSYIKTARTPGQLADVSEQANLGLIEATNLLKDIRAGKGTLGKLVTDEKLYNEVNAFVDAANAVATNLRNGRGTLGKLANDQAAYDSLAASLENLRQMTNRINNGEGSLGKLLNDDAFATSLSSTTKNLDSVTGRLNRGEGTAGKILTDDSLYKRIDALTARLEEVTTKLSSGDGTAAHLINDRQLYDNLNKAVTELNGLLSDVRKDPQKYLRVKVSIF
ncbi:MAG TPA: MlaD family protein [Vicinamibacterales bacterium]|jgi:phospholipid/cholesterol/gamma-HCH transport system substrate-binding protein|nr:MlaD family protein [Vicinamibacterales bacterium]